MRVTFICFAALSVLASAGPPDPSPSSFPAPPRMSAVQQEYMAGVRARAADAAAAATPPLLEFLATPLFRAALAQQSPALGALAPAALLHRFRDALPLSEIAHGFPANFDAASVNGLDFGLDVAEGATFFPNQWQLPLMYPARELEAFYELISFLAPAAATEVGLLGMRPFSRAIPFPSAHPMWPGGFPANLSEASDRIVYGIFNQHKVDFPNFLWGDVALIFNNSRVGDMALLTPMDSGDFSIGCNATFTQQLCSSWTNASACGKFWYCQWGAPDAAAAAAVCRGLGQSSEHDCSAWGTSHTLGTLEHFEHLLLPYAGWYRDADEAQTRASRLASLFARALVPWQAAAALPNMTTYPRGSFDYYFEANLAGNPPLPGAVAFAIASLPSLFGSAAGEALRRWATASRWALVWSLGANNGAHGETIPTDGWPANTRVLDASVLPSAAVGWNLTDAASASAASFDAQWAKTKAARAGAGSAGLPGSFFDGVWAALEAEPLLLQPMYPGLCAAPASCIGTNRNGECVCVRE